MARAPLTPSRRARRPSPRERVVGFGLFVLLAAAMGLFLLAGARPGPAPSAPPPGSAPAPADADPLPLRSPGGWVRGEIETYDPDTLFEKIDGKADAYLAYDVVGLTFASYADPAAPDDYVDVYLYDMGEPMNAYGMYRAERTGAEAPVPLGEEGCAPGGAVFARKGTIYQQVLPGSDAAAAEAFAVARRAADAIAPADPAPADPDWFPAEGRTVIRYELRDCLMIPSLAGAHLAVYADGTKVVVATAESEEDAARVATEAKESLEFLGTPATFRAVGSRVVGVVGAPDEGRGARLLETVERRVRGDR